MAEILSIDGLDLDLSQVDEKARELLETLIYIDEKIMQLESEWAVADTARLAYSAALRGERITKGLKGGAG